MKQRFAILLMVIITASACSTTQQVLDYNPSKLWSQTSCSRPLIVRHKTKGIISDSQKHTRLTSIGLVIYDGTKNGRSLSGRKVIYSDTFIPQENCENSKVDITLTTGFQSFDSYSKNNRQIRPVYILHLKSEIIDADDSIICRGVFDDYESKRVSGIVNFQYVYNEELCWSLMSAFGVSDITP